MESVSETQPAIDYGSCEPSRQVKRAFLRTEGTRLVAERYQGLSRSLRRELGRWLMRETWKGEQTHDAHVRAK